MASEKPWEQRIRVIEASMVDPAAAADVSATTARRIRRRIESIGVAEQMVRR